MKSSQIALPILCKEQFPWRYKEAILVPDSAGWKHSTFLTYSLHPKPLQYLNMSACMHFSFAKWDYFKIVSSKRSWNQSNKVSMVHTRAETTWWWSPRLLVWVLLKEEKLNEWESPQKHSRCAEYWLVSTDLDAWAGTALCPHAVLWAQAGCLSQNSTVCSRCLVSSELDAWNNVAPCCFILSPPHTHSLDSSSSLGNKNVHKWCRFFSRED